jgi:hypothetical protein
MSNIDSATSSNMPNMNTSVSATSSANMSSFDKVKTNVKNFLLQDRGTATVLVGLLVAFAIFIFSHEKTYQLTNKYIGGTVDKDNTPSDKGMLLHATFGGLVVGIIVYLGYTEVLTSWKKFLQ